MQALAERVAENPRPPNGASDFPLRRPFPWPCPWQCTVAGQRNAVVVCRVSRQRGFRPTKGYVRAPSTNFLFADLMGLRVAQLVMSRRRFPPRPPLAHSQLSSIELRKGAKGALTFPHWPEPVVDTTHSKRIEIAVRQQPAK